jgi:hypothetical protein
VSPLPGRNVGHSREVYDDATGAVVAYNVRQPDGTIRREAVPGRGGEAQARIARENARIEAAQWRNDEP